MAIHHRVLGLGLHSALFLFAALAGLSLGCGDSGSSQNNATSGAGGAGGNGSGGGSGTGGTAGAGGAGGGGSVLGFQPSNVDIDDWDLSKVGDVIISGANSDIYTEQGMWAGVDPQSYVHQFVELADKSKLSVFVVKSLRIEANVLVRTFEPQPAIVIALEDMTLLGSIQVLPGTAGGAVGKLMNMKGEGLGGGPTGSEAASGGGASYCGLGGKGIATTGGTAGMPTAAYGTTELVPLVGGSSGGAGALSGTGPGGGAIQLVAGGELSLGVGAFVNAGGGGGVYGGNGAQQAGGAGSGGSILIEATKLTLLGALTANGGGGGQGNGDAGEDGRPDDMPAAGGDNGTAIGPGGNGSGAGTIDGASGGTNGVDNPGSGGGAAGRIRINTPDGKVDLSKAIVSPSTTTPCATMGTVKSG